LILTAAALGSCGFFNASAFSPDLSLLQAQYDLSTVIPESEGEYYAIGVADVGESRYVIVVSPKPESATPLTVFDGSLNLIQQYSKGEFFTAGPGVMTDAGTPTKILVGNRVLTVAGTGLTPSMALGSPIPSWDFGFAITYPAHPADNVNIANMAAYDSSILQWCRWNADWSTGAAPVSPMYFSVMIGSAADSFTLEKVSSDPQAEKVTLTLMDMKNKVEYFVKVPWADFTSAPTGPLLTQYSSTTFSRTPLRADHMGYAQGLFIGFENTSQDSKVGDFIRFDASGTRDERLHFESLPEIRAAYPGAGDAYYVFDRQKRTVSRLAPWWPLQ
jgi:hypothetical protein